MKGQYFSFDAIIGASIFILTLVAVMSYWYGVNSSIEQQQSSLSREAIRVSEMLYSPQALPYGATVGWDDTHLNWSRIYEDFCWNADASEVLGSEYGVAIHFSTVSGAHECWWYSTPKDSGATGSNYIIASEIFRMRRVGSYFIGGEVGGYTELGYVDVHIYNPYITE